MHARMHALLWPRDMLAHVEHQKGSGSVIDKLGTDVVVTPSQLLSPLHGVAIKGV